MKRFLTFSSFFAVCVIVAPDPILAQEYGSGEIIIKRIEEPSAGQAAVVDNEILHAILNGGMQDLSLKNADAVRDFYAKRGYETYWVGGGWLDDDARGFADILGRAWTHGLNPYAYHYAEIMALYGDGDRDEGGDARLEILLSDAFASYGRDLSGIRVDPRVFKSNVKFWQQPFSAESVLGLLRDDDVEDIAKTFTPQGVTYNRMRERLEELVSEAPAEYEQYLPIDIGRVLQPGQEHRAMQDLRRRLGVVYGGQPWLYDDMLAAAVMAFQRAEGLKADGVIGPATLQRLNMTRMDRIEQIIVNLERLRWVPENKPDKFVVVNVPSAKLWAIDDGAVAFDMDVVVGRSSRPTNIFVSNITGVRLNPNWTVPPTIKREDILPKLVENPNYLSTKGMELISGYGADAVTLDPALIDWASVSPGELGAFRMVQVPGAHNPLGAVRVLMPNGYNIYLHDTNEKHYFERSNRAISSGCVRMKDPLKVAEFILEGKDGWGVDRVNEVLGAGRMRDVFVGDVIPVYIVYYTAWMDDRGAVVFGDDPYDYDPVVLDLLSKVDGFYIPRHTISTD